MGSFSDIPPFPSDIPTASLSTISLQKLVAHDSTEAARLFDCARETGFFYLDYRNTPEEASLEKNLDALFELGKEVFNESDEEKEKWKPMQSEYLTGYAQFSVPKDASVPLILHSYKQSGSNPVDDQGHKDYTEFCNVSKTELFSYDPMPLPTLLNNHQHLLMSFATTCHSFGSLALNSLNASLDLPPGTLASMHNLMAKSNDQIRFTKSISSGNGSDKSDVSLNEHTDVGSISILFNRVGGLQVLPPGSSTWLYVPPRPGHAVCNLGDAMVRWTNALFNSNIHRVVEPPGEQAGLERYSLVYFLRPDFSAKIRRLESRSGVIPPLREGQEDESLDTKSWTRGRFEEIAQGKGLQEKKNLKIKGFEGEGVTNGVTVKAE